MFGEMELKINNIDVNKDTKNYHLKSMLHVLLNSNKLQKLAPLEAQGSKYNFLRISQFSKTFCFSIKRLCFHGRGRGRGIRGRFEF